MESCETIKRLKDKKNILFSQASVKKPTQQLSVSVIIFKKHYVL